MLSGENSILIRAGEARDGSIESQEKEKIELAYEAALINNYDTMNIDEFELERELNKLEGENKTDVTKISENEFEIFFTDTGNGYIKSTNEITKISEQNVKKCTAYTYDRKHNLNFANVLYRTGKLIRQEISADVPTVYAEIKEDTSIVISENVKDYIDDYTINQLFYRTKDNKLYCYNDSTSSLIGENVIRYDFYPNKAERLYYVDQENNLYEFSIYDENAKKIAENVKDYFIETSGASQSPVFYVDNSNNLYTHQGLLVHENVKYIDQFLTNGDYNINVITQDNDIYRVNYNRTATVVNDVPCDGFNKTLYGKNAKKVYGAYYVDVDNNIRRCTINEWNNILASNVKKFIGYREEFYYYLDQNNNLYVKDKKIDENVINATSSHFINNNGDYYYYSYYDEKVLISSNVKEFYSDGTYLKNDNTLVYQDTPINNVEKYIPESIQIISEGKRIYLINNEEVIMSGKYWYQKADGKIYHKTDNRNNFSS